MGSSQEYQFIGHKGMFLQIGRMYVSLYQGQIQFIIQQGFFQSSSIVNVRVYPLPTDFAESVQQWDKYAFSHRHCGTNSQGRAVSKILHSRF